MSNCDLAEHVERAMRDNGQLPQWKRTTSPVAPEELVLSLDCGVRVVAQDFGDWPLLITTIPQLSTKGGLLDLARKAPAHLAPVFEDAAAELRQIAAADAEATAAGGCCMMEYGKAGGVATPLAKRAREVVGFDCLSSGADRARPDLKKGGVL